MAKEWTDDEVQAAIKEAIQIVREDRFEKFARSTLGTNTNNPPPSSGNNPPPSGGDNPPTGPGSTPKKKSIFWGEAVD